ncbi:MAG: stage II sporulation protein M [Lachnospiraceae bacterium]|nr:stage II sporulation protein M [Lachnospiraceae bacterium]
MKQTGNTQGERGYLSPFLWLFFIIGIVFSIFLSGRAEEELLFSGSRISTLRTGGFQEKGFFIHVLFSRLSYVVVVILLSTTSFRKIFLILQPILLSLGIGGWIGAAIAQFGIKGILLILAGMFPHMFLYILVLRFLLMLLWERTYYDKQFFIAICILLFMVIIGCLFESYVNPMIVAKVLKIF